MCENNFDNYIDMPVVPLRGLVVFPEWCFILTLAEKRALQQLRML